jgi:superfamily I DNA/RNA helicase
MPYAPNNPRVIFVDEAQDFTKLQLTVIRNWGLNAEWIVLVGDDDQTIYGFTGATHNAFLQPPLPDKYKTVLKWSYRVPKVVLLRSQRLIQRVAHREPKEYHARTDFKGDEVEGELISLPYNFRMPEELLTHARRYIEADKRVMFLGSCAYMIDPIKQELHHRGFPFHNPYRRRRGDWNPLASGGNRAIRSIDLLLSFLEAGNDEPYWNIPQFVQWAKFIGVSDTGKIRNQGNKAIKILEEAIEAGEKGLHTCREVIDKVLHPTVIQHALNRDLDWFTANLLNPRQKSVAYPVKVLKNHGKEVLKKDPSVILGTIHSVKGGEADVVYLFPDISYQAMQEGYTRSGRDALCRLFYVGMTRAKETLILCAPASGRTQHSQLFIDL